MSLKGAFGKKQTSSKTTEEVDENKKKKLKIEKDKYNFNLLSPTERTEKVKEKIIKASREDPKNVDEKKLQKVAAKLAEEEGIKEAYLNKSFKSAMEYFQMVPKEKKIRSSLISEVESIPSSDSKHMDEDEDEEIFEDNSDIFLKTNEKIKIKLVITEIAKNNKDKTIRKILSPFASTFDISPQCGKKTKFLKQKVCFILHFLLVLGI
jgi:site-specific recombinase XerC